MACCSATARLEGLQAAVWASAEKPARWPRGDTRAPEAGAGGRVPGPSKAVLGEDCRWRRRTRQRPSGVLSLDPSKSTEGPQARGTVRGQ